MPAFAAEPETRPPISRFCRPLVEPQRWRQNLHSDLGMANMQREESKHEKLERQQREREREAMRQAVAAYAGPITKCPPYKTTDPLARPRGRLRWPRRNADGRSE
jgi:septal ring factor EnvC (AmiA/AmiB activator)